MKVSCGLLAVALVAALGAGCGDPASPGIQPRIINVADNFEYQISNVRNYTGTATFTWSNTGTTANVNQSASITGGSVRLVILDAANVQVYSRSLADNGTFITSAGTTGAWTVRVEYSNGTGTVNFRAQKTT